MVWCATRAHSWLRMPGDFLQFILSWNLHSAIRIPHSEICMQLSIFCHKVNNFRDPARSVPQATNLWKKMLADFYLTGYIASNIVKDSTKSVQPNVFLSPLNGVVLSLKLSHAWGGCVRGCLLLEPVVNETFRFSETKTSRFLHRDSGRTR